MLNVPDVFTRGAMKALVQAQISAASMGYEKMGTGHLLCGLCRVSDELTRCILGDLTVNEVEEEVSHHYGRGEVGFSRVTGLTPPSVRFCAQFLMQIRIKSCWQALLISGRSFCTRMAARR